MNTLPSSNTQPVILRQGASATQSAGPHKPPVTLRGPSDSGRPSLRVVAGSSPGEQPDCSALDSATARRMTVVEGGKPSAPKVAGLVKMSTTDWPGKLAAVVFLQGCPWRCVYCHNEAILDPRAPGTMEWSEVMAFLRKRRGLLDGVVFSGGEPLIDAALPDAVRAVREMGFAIGLHTGGAWPKRLAALLGSTPSGITLTTDLAPAAAHPSTHDSTYQPEGNDSTYQPEGNSERLIDWVGLDIKHLSDKYSQVTGVKVSGRGAYESLGIVVESGVDHEVRTTVDPTVHTHDDVVQLIAYLRGYQTPNGNIVQKHVLQEARPDGAAAHHADAFTAWRLRHLIAERETRDVAVRAA